jgi:hypothetical protein
MEGCWLYALMSLLNKQAAGGRLSAFAFLLLYLAAFGCNKLLRRLRWPGFCLSTISWLAWAIAMLLIVKTQLFGGLPWSDTQWLMAIPRAIAEVIYTFRPELLILVSSVVIWWLGRRLAQVRVRFTVLVAEFQFGFVILLLAFFVANQVEIKLADSFPVTLAFFLFALTGIPLAHALEGESWLSGLYGHWSGLLLMSIGLIILFGLIISWIVTPDFMQIIIGVVKWVWGLIMKALEFIMSLFPEPEPGELPEMPQSGMGTPEEDITKFWTIPVWLRSGLRTGWCLLVLGMIIFALWRISSEVFSWLRRRLTTMAGAEFEPVPSTFGADLMNLLKRIMRGLFRVRLLFRFGRRSAAMLPEVAPVRQIYRQLLHWAATGGCARSVSQTPHEYLYTLVERVPEAQQDMAFITQQYVAVRYGTLLPDEDRIQQLRQTWQRVKKTRLKKTGGENAPQ